MKKTILLTFLFFVQYSIFSQSTYDPSTQNQWLVERYEIKSKYILKYIHTSQKQFYRESIAETIDSFDIVGAKLSKVDFENFKYFQSDNPDFSKSLSGKSKFNNPVFYKQKAFLYHINTHDFSLYINPVIDFSLGKENTSESIYNNTRGIEVRGQISKKIGFYSLILENQKWMPEYLQNYIGSHKGAIPGVGFAKTFKTNQFNNAYDFFNSRAYITFSPTKNIVMQFGQDRNFIGNGYRSFILSDFANEYPFLKIRTKVWRFQYQNLFAKMSNFKGYTVGLKPEDKYMALHHISYNVSKKLNIGLFESVIFERNDTGQTKGFDIAYLNPVIFYRSVEHNNNSSDNQTLGLDWKWNPFRQLSIYGQIVFDEFLFKDLLKQNSKWTNKYAIQIGVKYIDMFNIRNLDWQIEGNIARPYTFTHFRQSTNYAHYGMPLAHPLGANFKELINIFRWQPHAKVFITLKNIFVITGLDTGNLHYGSNIFADYHQRIGAGNPNQVHNIGQGIHTTINFTELLISYMFKHNVYLDLDYIYRIQKSDLKDFTYNNKMLTLGLRMNIIKRDYSF